MAVLSALKRFNALDQDAFLQVLYDHVGKQGLANTDNPFTISLLWDIYLGNGYAACHIARF